MRCLSGRGRSKDGQLGGAHGGQPEASRAGWGARPWGVSRGPVTWTGWCARAGVLEGGCPRAGAREGRRAVAGLGARTAQRRRRPLAGQARASPAQSRGRSGAERAAERGGPPGGGGAVRLAARERRLRGAAQAPRTRLRRREGDVGPGGQFGDAVVPAEAPSFGEEALAPCSRLAAPRPRAPGSGPAAKPRRRLGLEQTRGAGDASSAPLGAHQTQPRPTEPRPTEPQPRRTPAFLLPLEAGGAAREAAAAGSCGPAGCPAAMVG